MFGSTTQLSEKGKAKSYVFILFSGHNDRAIITLCRYFAASEVQFAIVCSSEADLITQTEWSVNCIISRIDKNLDLKLFDVVVNAIKQIYEHPVQPIYCPTSEFMNYFVLKERDALTKIGWIFTLPSAEVYQSLTSKALSQKIIKKLTRIMPPAILPWDSLRAPCVLKPRMNVNNGKVLYPKICQTETELNEALDTIEPANWFAQTWVEGQSYYLCAYISKNEEHEHFWQENLLQQPGGKSIVLARTTKNPGIDISNFFKGLVDLGYNGPFMMEVIRDQSGIFHYIEINPRFWGPLQLTLDACPDIINLFLDDAGVSRNSCTKKNENLKQEVYWYAWGFGAKKDKCRKYPASVEVEIFHSLQSLVDKWDVYNKSDSQLLRGRH